MDKLGGKQEKRTNNKSTRILISLPNHTKKNLPYIAGTFDTTSELIWNCKIFYVPSNLKISLTWVFLSNIRWVSPVILFPGSKPEVPLIVPEDLEY